MMLGNHMDVDTTPGLRSLKLSFSDKNHLIKMALEAEVAKKKSELARVEWQQGAAASEAAGDAMRAKMQVPQEAQDVTIDLNEGIIRFRMPGIPPDSEPE